MDTGKQTCDEKPFDIIQTHTHTLCPVPYNKRCNRHTTVFDTHISKSTLPAPTPTPPPSVRRVPPRFSIPPADSEIMPGGSVNITCVAVGSPMPYVKWMLGTEDLTPEDDMPIGRNVLELGDVRQSNNYTCVAMSTLGVIEAVAQIIVKGVCGCVCARSIEWVFSFSFVVDDC